MSDMLKFMNVYVNDAVGMVHENIALVSNSRHS
jgi:hypothetical protein